MDAKMFCSYNLEIYLGKQPQGRFIISNKPTEVVKRLTKPLFGSGHNIAADNWFSDLDLVKELKHKNCPLSVLRKKIRQLPPQFVATKGRKQYTSKFGFNKDTTLVSYATHQQNNVILVSTLHDDKSIDPDSGEKINQP